MQFYIMNSKIAITAIVLVAVIMGMSAVAPAMAGNHGNSPPDVTPCEELENPSDDRPEAKSGKDKAKAQVC